MPLLYVFREIIVICCSHKDSSFALFYVDLFEPQRRLPVKKTRQQLQREKALLEQSQKLGLQDASASLPPEQLLSAPTQKVTNQKLRPSPAVSSPLTLASSTGNGKPQGIESQPQEPGLQNSQDGHRNAEVLTPKPNCKVEKKKMELLVSLWDFSSFSPGTGKKYSLLIFFSFA